MHKSPFVILNGLIIVAVIVYIAMLFVPGQQSGTLDTQASGQAAVSTTAHQAQDSHNTVATQTPQKQSADDSMEQHEKQATSPSHSARNKDNSGQAGSTSRQGDAGHYTGTQAADNRPSSKGYADGSGSIRNSPSSTAGHKTAEHSARNKPEQPASTPVKHATKHAPTHETRHTSRSSTSGCQVSTKAGKPIMVATSTVNVRAGASTQQAVVGQVSRGAKVLVEGASANGWIYLQRCNLTGWAYKPLFKSP